MIGLYLFGILCGILYAVILKVSRFKGEPVPFVMELPNYRLPSAKSVVHLIWEKAKGFIQKAFTIIFAASIVIWFLQTFDARFNVVSMPESSLLAALGSIFAPLFAPLGFADWRVSTALITGFTAKESVVSTLTLLLGGEVSSIGTVYAVYRGRISGIRAALHPLCCGNCHRKAARWQHAGCHHDCADPMRDRMAFIAFCRPLCRSGIWPGIRRHGI